MGKRYFESRLQSLEDSLKMQLSGLILIEMNDNRVRVSRVPHRGEEQVFPSVQKAAQYVEKLISDTENVNGEVLVSNICDLYSHSDDLKKIVSGILGTDELPALIFLGGIKKFETVDFPFFALARALHYFDTVSFQQHYKTGEYTDQERKMFLALYEVYCWDRSGSEETLFLEFEQLIFQIGQLPRLEAA